MDNKNSKEKSKQKVNGNEKMDKPTQTLIIVLICVFIVMAIVYSLTMKL